MTLPVPSSEQIFRDNLPRANPENPHRGDYQPPTLPDNKHTYSSKLPALLRMAACMARCP
jgi:hypothetical protein